MGPPIRSTTSMVCAVSQWTSNRRCDLFMVGAGRTGDRVEQRLPRPRADHAGHHPHRFPSTETPSIPPTASPAGLVPSRTLYRGGDRAARRAYPRVGSRPRAVSTSVYRSCRHHRWRPGGRHRWPDDTCDPCGQVIAYRGADGFGKNRQRGVDADRSVMVCLFE